MVKLVAIFAAWLGVQKLTDSNETTKPDNPTITTAKWATLVYDGKSIDWIGDEKIMSAVSAKGLRISFINISDDTLEKMHLKPIVQGIGTPAFILQNADGQIVYSGKTAKIEDVTAILGKIPQPTGD